MSGGRRQARRRANTNGLVRQYFPKGASFATVPAEEVERIQSLLNARPRKIPDFKSPQEV